MRASDETMTKTVHNFFCLRLRIIWLIIRQMRYLRRSWTSGRWLVRLATLGMGVVIVGIVGTLGLFAYYAKDLPSPDKVVRREGFATKIYDRNGKLLYDVFSGERRNPVDINQVPLVVKQATISIEDKNFYKHGGFDVGGILRGAFRSIFLGRLQGGSTLTQQLVKNALLTSQRTITRKLKEFILTVQVERKYTKDQILQMYLNEAPYGGTAWGIATAADMYFGKTVDLLTLPEAVILAGLPQSPSRYSPDAGTLYVDRAKEVLRRMREDEYITRSQELEVSNQLAKVQFATQSGLLKAPHFVFYVKDQLIARYGEKQVEEGGLRVTTTLDLGLQEAAQSAVTEEVAKVKSLKISNGAAVAMDPKTGQILAMVGSKGWSDPTYDGKYNVTTASRQPGSTIKPVVYLTGLRKGYTASTLLMDTKTSFPGGDKPEYIPENYDGKFRGPILVREALGNSINVPAVKMVSLVGIRDMLEVAYDMGFSTLRPTAETLARVGLSVALGGGEVKPIELVSAYSAFANGGKRVEPVAILKVADGQGRVLEEWNPSASSGRAVMTPDEAFTISSILSDPKARDITFGPRSLINVSGRTIAVKTGTTNDRRDNWTVGWTPSVTVGVWVGNNDNSPMREVASGVTGAAPIWRRIILEALKDKVDEPLKVPEGIVAMDVDKISGYRAHDGFEAKQEYFIKGTEPTADDPVHKKLKICKGEGKLATPADIANGNYEEKEFFLFKEEDPFDSAQGQNKWQEGILSWLSEQSDSKYHPPTEYCGSINQIVIIIQEPGDRSQVNGNDVRIRSDIAASNKVTKVEFKVDDVVRDTKTNSPWETIVNVPNGIHKIEVGAEDEKGNLGSKTIEIGVNQPWAEPTPTPTASP